MKLFTLFLIGFVSASDNFLKFVKKYNKVYDNEELAHRLKVFTANLEKIAKLNANEIETVYGVGPFTDLEEDEFNQMYTGWVPSTEEFGDFVDYNVTENAADIDWRTKNAITPVKDQGRCGSCWAFSATESIESLAFLSGKYSLEKMSAQQITACDKASGGCNGGNPSTAFDYVKNAGGLETEADYPYTAGGGSTGSCKFDKSKVKEKVTGQKKTKGEDPMLTALASQPMSVCHQTGGWQHYSGGSVMTSCSSGGGHCTQLTGYSSSGDYWIVKNSWGSSWGSSGYIYIKKGQNLCGLANTPMWPTV